MLVEHTRGKMISQTRRMIFANQNGLAQMRTKFKAEEDSQASEDSFFYDTPIGNEGDQDNDDVEDSPAKIDSSDITQKHTFE